MYKLRYSTVAVTCLIFISLTQQLPGQKIRVEIDIDVKFKADRNAVEIEGKTNLPPGTRLEVYATPKELVLQMDDRGSTTPPPGSTSGLGWVKTLITKNGLLKDTLKIQGPVKTGDYLIHVQVMPGSSQEADVLKIIGNMGENLEGPLTRLIEGFGSRGRIVIKETTVEFRKDENDKILRREGKKYKKALKLYEKAFSVLEQIRQRQNSLSRVARSTQYRNWAYSLTEVQKVVEQFESQSAVAHLRPVWHSLERLKDHSMVRSDDYEKAVEKYKRELEKAHAFLEGIK